MLIGDESAPLQRDDPVGGARGLLRVGCGQQDRAALGRVRPQHAVQPAALAAREPLGGAVEDEGVRVGQQRAGQAEATVHAAREGAEAFLAQADESDHLQDFVGAPGRNARGGAQHAQIPTDRARRVPGEVAQQHADFARRMGDAVQGAAPEVGDSTAPLECEHESEHRRLARSRRPEQRGDAARVGLEGDVVDGRRKLLARVAGQSDGLDHSQQDSALCPFFRVGQGPLCRRDSAWRDFEVLVSERCSGPVPLVLDRCSGPLAYVSEPRSGPGTHVPEPRSGPVTHVPESRSGPVAPVPEPRSVHVPLVPELGSDAVALAPEPRSDPMTSLPSPPRRRGCVPVHAALPARIRPRAAASEG